MKRHRVEEEWQSLYDCALGPECPEQVRNAYRNMFFAGAVAFHRILTGSRPSASEIKSVLDDFDAELREFCATTAAAEEELQ
jgi:hypothetical protein